MLRLGKFKCWEDCAANIVLLQQAFDPPYKIESLKADLSIRLSTTSKKRPERQIV